MVFRKAVDLSDLTHRDKHNMSLPVFMALAAMSAGGSSVPNYHGCTTPEAMKLAFVMHTPSNSFFCVHMLQNLMVSKLMTNA